MTSRPKSVIMKGNVEVIHCHTKSRGVQGLERK